MNIFVKSRMEVESGDLPNVPFLLISITDPRQPLVNISSDPPIVAKLDLKFHDLDRPMGPNYLMFNSAMANKVWDFVEKSADLVDTIVVHCEAGISRSSAVAAAISRVLNGDDSYYFASYIPNRLVYRLMLEAARERMEI